MIRVLLAVLLMHFSITLVSCTSTETDENGASLNESAGPVDEAEVNDAGAAAAPKSGGEEDLETELDKETPQVEKKPGETAPPEQALEAPQQNEQPALEEQPGDNDGLDQDLADQDLKEEPAPQPPPTQSQDLDTEPALQDTPPPAVEPVVPAPLEKTKITDIRYMSNANGGTVVIETSAPVTYQSRLNRSTQQFVIEIADVELPPSLQRPYNMKDFGSRFGSINAYQSPGTSTARVVIQLSGPVSTEPIVQQEGTSLVVVPPAPPAPVAKAPVPEMPAETSKDALAAKTLDEFLTGNQKFYGRPISLQVKDADVRDVINFLAEESGANIVMSDEVTGKISLKLRKIPWDQALVTLMRSKGLGYVRQGNVLRINTLKALQGETEAATKIMEAQRAIVPAVVQVIPVSYANVDDLLKNIQQFLTKDTGKAMTDNRSNTIIVTDRAEVVDRIVRLVKTLDVAPQQVSIESKIVEAIEGFDTFVGINWSQAGAPVTLSNGGGANGAPVLMTLNTSSSSLSTAFAGGAPFTSSVNVGTLDVFGSLTAMLTLAETDSLAKVISAPRISTMNREKSTILQQGENVTVISTRSETTGLITKQEKRTPFKLQLDVTPQITADGGVIMFLDVQRDFLGPIVDQETQSRAVNTRRASTKILVRNGQTAVIGGIYTSDESESTRGIPGLMHIPVLGWLFKNRSFSRAKNELLIFMTPRILASEANGGTEQAAN